MSYSNIKLLFVSLVFLSGCNKYVDIDPPKDQVLGTLAFADDQTAEAAVVGIYTRMNMLNYQFANVLGNVITGMSADEIYYATTFATYDQFRNNALLPSNNYIASLWSQPYNLIYQANSCIEGLKGAASLTPSVRNQLLGEAFFVRSFCYFYLVNYFGNVPLITTTDYRLNNTLPRTDTAIVYDTIQSGLSAAVGLLAEDYTGAKERIRPNKAAAQALNARVALYRNKWAEAEQSSSAVINNAQYSLMDDLNGVFLKNSQEAIWQLQAVNPLVNTFEGNILVPVSTPYYRLDTNLVHTFEAGDLRRQDWIGTYTAASGTVSYYPLKYKVRTRTGTTVTEYSMVLRLAEQYLIRAEARAQQGKLDLAIEDLDAIRHRAGLGTLPATLDQASVLAAVQKERQLELFTEWAHRWMDLKRTGRASAVLEPVKTGWKPSAVYYPIPLNAISTNPALTQNDGY